MNPVQDLDLNAASAPFQPALGFSLPMKLSFIFTSCTKNSHNGWWEGSIVSNLLDIPSVFQLRVVKHAPQISKIPQNTKTVEPGES